jgi:hypothetical protein
MNMRRNPSSGFAPAARFYRPDGRESALLLLRLIEARDAEREKPTTRVRLAEITLKRLWNRQRLSEQFLSEVSDWLLSAGWAFVFAGTTYAAVQTSAVENWPAISSKRIRAEIEAVHGGKFDFNTLEHLFRRASDDQHDGEERHLTDE